MANKFTRFIQGVGQGALQPKGNMGDFRHATRLYLDNGYALAPRTKFLYHVYFDVNPLALTSPSFKEKHLQETGLLCKSADLPKFTIETVTKNQYNRKKVVQKQIQYDPVSISMHDDNVGVINALWAQYMGYYYRDRHNQIKQFYDNDPYYGVAKHQNRRYGLDNNVTVPFFRSIQIFTLSRQRFNGYTLVNPVITSWQHGSVDQSQGNGVNESHMTVAYEAVLYSTGSVRKDNPKGFAKLHYDNSPSPLSVLGGGTGTLFGSGGVLAGLGQVGAGFGLNFGQDTGVVAGAREIYGDVDNGFALDSPQNFLRTALAAVNTFNNIRKLSKESLLAEGTNLLLGGNSLENNISGLAGSVFPSRSESGGATTGEQKTTR